VAKGKAVTKILQQFGSVNQIYNELVSINGEVETMHSLQGERTGEDCAFFIKRMDGHWPCILYKKNRQVKTVCSSKENGWASAMHSLQKERTGKDCAFLKNRKMITMY